MTYDLLNLPKPRATPLPPPRAPTPNPSTALVPREERPLTASVAHIKLDDRKGMQSLADSSRPVAEKQRRCWDTYERNPLLARPISFVGNSISRLRIVPAYDAGEGDGPVEDWSNPRMNAIIADLDRNVDAKGGMSGINYLFRQISVHLALTGESFYYAREIDDGSGGLRRVYSIYSTEELRRQGGRMEYVAYPGAVPEEIKVGPLADGYLLRFWKPSERYSEVAHTEIFSALDDLDDWEMLTAALAAIDKSRIGAGMLPIVGDVNWPADPNGRHRGGNQGFVTDVLEHFEAPIRDRTSAASVVPFIVGGVTKEQADAMKPVYFGRQPQEIDVKRIEELTHRIAMIMPIPAEVLFGKENMNHFTGWLLNEDEWKSVEPIADLAANVTTRGIARPTLLQMGESPEETAKWWLWYDPIDLIHRPDQTQVATDGAKLGFVGGKGWRAIAGIPEEAAPVDEADKAVLSAPPGERVVPGQEDRTIPEAPVGITAALTPQLQAVTKLGPKLSRLDRDLRTKLQLGAELAIKEAVKRVGAKLRSKLTPDQKRQYATTANYELPAHLGRAMVGQLGIDAAKSVAESISPFLADADRWMRSTWEQAQAAVSLAAGVTPSAVPNWAQVSSQFRNELQAETEIRLWAPHPTMPDKGEWGEGLTASIMPAIRSLLDTIGATSRSILDTVVDAFGDESGASLRTVYVWSHLPGLREFPSHEELDEVEFDSWDDPRLAVKPEDEWLGVPFYHPGDHAGCGCVADVELRLGV